MQKLKLATPEKSAAIEALYQQADPESGIRGVGKQLPYIRTNTDHYPQLVGFVRSGGKIYYREFPAGEKHAKMYARNEDGTWSHLGPTRLRPWQA